MTTGPLSPEELSDDLVLAMRHLQPSLAALLALLQNADRAAESRIEAMTTVLERVATALEGATGHLQVLGPKMQAQETGLRDLSGQVVGLGQRLDQQDRSRVALQERIDALLAVLTRPQGLRG